MQNGTQKMQTEQPRPENQHKPANRYKPVRQRLSYKGAWKDRFKKFIFGSKEKEGAGKQTVVYILLISIGFVYLYPLLYMIRPYSGCRPRRTLIITRMPPARWISGKPLGIRCLSPESRR